ncbi:hypothetical protein ES703_14527 [subsurface metagenome]
MKRTCAWCQKPMTPTEEEPRDKISWTFCEECAKKMRETGFEDGKFIFQVTDERTT